MAAGRAGLSRSCLRRAKASLGIRSQKLGQPGTDLQYWAWALPSTRLASEDAALPEGA